MANYYRCAFCKQKFSGRGIRQHLKHIHGQPSHDRAIRTYNKRGRWRGLRRISDGVIMATWTGSFKE